LAIFSNELIGLNFKRVLDLIMNISRTDEDIESLKTTFDAKKSVNFGPVIKKFQPVF